MPDESPIPQCALDRAGLEDQGARYARLARSVAAATREPEVLIVDFEPDLDRALLDEALAVERRCCPFFTLGYDEQRRRLRASVSDADHLPALDALADALQGSGNE